MEYIRGRSSSPGTWFLVFIPCVAGAAACGTFNPSTPTSRFVSSSPNVLSVMNWTANNGQLTIHTAAYNMQAKGESGNQALIGMNYPSLVHLILPDGQAISPKLVSLAQVILPNQVQSGYMIFPSTPRLTCQL